MLGIQKGWSRLQVQDYLRKHGLCLITSDERHSIAESLVVCLIQHSSGRYCSLYRISNAIESVLEKEADQIRFRLRLSEKQYTAASPFKPLLKDVVSFIHQFDSNFDIFFPVAIINSRGIVKIISKDGQKNGSKDLLLWQDGQKGLFSCITERRNMFKDAEDYALALFRDIILIRDIMFHHLELMEDAAVENAALSFGDQIQSCKTPGEYLAVISQCKITESDRWKLIALEELANFGHQLSEEMERDLKEEINDCLARASEDTYLRRKNDYETACQKDVERENERERHNRQLKEEMEATRKEIAELEADIEETRKKESEMQKEYEKHQSQAKNKKEQELQAKTFFEQKSKVIGQKQEELRKQKAQAEAGVKRIQKEENLAIENAKKASREIDRAGNQLNSVHHTARRRRDQLEEHKENIARLEKEQHQLSLEERQLTTESQSKTESKQEKLQNVKKNQDRIQQLRERNAWRQFQIALDESIPPYQLVAKKNSFLQKVDGIKQLDRLVELINSEFHIDINDYQYLIYYTRNCGASKEQHLNLVKNTIRRLLVEPKCDYVQNPWRISGSALLLSQVREQITKNPCEEIHFCASKVLYVDCDWAFPGTSVALSAPRVQIIGDARRIDTSGRSAQEFDSKKAANGKRKGENGDHGKSGAAGESAGNFSIDCVHLSGGKLHVVANGGKGADGQDGGDGQEGSDGGDGKDGEISDRPLEGIGIINAELRPREELVRFAKGEKGTAGQAGGCGGNGGVGCKGGRKGVVTSTITTTGRGNLTSVSEDGPDGQDGIPGQGAKGGGGGRNGRDRALAFEPTPLGLSGCWNEACGDLELEECRGILISTFVLGYTIVKKGEDKGRASRGEDGKNGKEGDQRQRATANAKKKITNVEHVWNSDVIRQQPKNSDTTELAQLEAENRRAQEEITQLAKQEAEINFKLNLVKQQKSAVDKNKTKESSAASAAQQEASQLEKEKKRIQEAIQQQNASLLRNQQEAENLKTDAEKRKIEVEKLARSAAEQKAASDLEMGQVKAVLSRATEETKAAELVAKGSHQLVDDIQSDRIKIERAVQKDRKLMDQCTETVASNERGMEEDRKHWTETKSKLQQLSGMDDLKGRILKKARVVQQLRTERIAVMEDNEIPHVQNDDSWPSGSVNYIFTNL